ncbi:hypothetical protein N9D11_00005 [Candidatus Pelagibacter sp.]|nr:hypothetical protein [Candidatus Pelagibacter sp.]
MSGDIKRDKIRVLFENDEIGVEKEKPDKQISWKLRYSTSCRYRDWERAKGGYYIWGVEDNIAAR